MEQEEKLLPMYEHIKDIFCKGCGFPTHVCNCKKEIPTDFMKRRKDESFADYKKRRAGEDKAIRLHLRGEEIKYTYKECREQERLWGINE